ncbi:hypothetical protein ONE63_005011 [Megalurothrips usitatus]|uniref:Uncharacterized protein n=1 Tax=Megalurothrips usitatus TaxID=439358 RepID=A0AAV7X3Z7_9NEOP|nr:hypothetical protein ONE63_005011 [Megalurothrips usitatus]
MQLTIDDVRSRLAELKTFVAHAGKQCEDTLEVVQTDEDLSKHNDGGTMESHVHISGDSENNPKQSAQTDSRHHGCRNGRGYYRPQAEGAPFRSPDNSKDDDGFTREFVQKARGHSKKKDHVSKQFTQKDEDHGTMGNWRGCDGHSSNVPSWRRRHLGASARSDHSQDDGRVTTEPVNKDKDFSKDDDGNPMHFGQIDKVQSEGDGCVLQPDTGLFKDKGLSTLPKAQRKEVMGHTKTQIRLKKNPATPMVEVSSELSETKNVSQGTSTSIASRETLENRQIPELHSKQPSPNQQPSVTADINVSAKRVESRSSPLNGKVVLLRNTQPWDSYTLNIGQIVVARYA